MIKKSSKFIECHKCANSVTYLKKMSQNVTFAIYFEMLLTSALLIQMIYACTCIYNKTTHYIVISLIKTYIYNFFYFVYRFETSPAEYRLW